MNEKCPHADIAAVRHLSSHVWTEPIGKDGFSSSNLCVQESEPTQGHMKNILAWIPVDSD